MANAIPRAFDYDSVTDDANLRTNCHPEGKATSTYTHAHTHTHTCIYMSINQSSLFSAKYNKLLQSK